MHAPDHGPGSLAVSPVERPAGQGLPPNQAWTDAQLAQRMLDRNGNPVAGPGSNPTGGNVGLSSSLPSKLDSNGNGAHPQGRSNSSLGHYVDSKGGSQQYAPSVQTTDTSSITSTRSKNDKGNQQRTSYHPSLSTIKSSHGSSAMASSDRDDSSAGENTTKKISGPLNAVPIPAGTKFGNKEGTASGSELSPAGGDRDRKAKSGRFWPKFGKSRCFKLCFSFF